MDYSSSLDASSEWKPEAAALLSEPHDEAKKGVLMTSERNIVQESSLSETPLLNGTSAESGQADLIELERIDESEDCPGCRSLDCDIIFALIFTLVIGCLLVLIMVFWLRGVFQYQGLVLLPQA